jgi:hypothetical protein
MRNLVGLLLFASATLSLHAQAHPLAPALSSRPGAQYTMYLNFSGFNYPGTWGGQTPGNVPAYDNAGASFTAAQAANIKNIWTRIADAYSMFDINVTTVDPAVAAGQAADDLTRYNYYQATPRFMHTVIANGASNFFGNAGGVSYVGVMHNAATLPGRHTNWAFVNRLGGVNAFHNIYTASAHELGHAAGLNHQGDYTTTAQVNEYSTNNGSATIAPTVGVAYGAARGVWRQGRIGVSTTQNDPRTILTSNPSMTGFVNDGIGRSLATATPLSLFGGGSINYNLASGIIVPASATVPNPIGEANYTSGFYSFTTLGGTNRFILNAGRQAINPGHPDPDPQLDGTLRILNSVGGIVAEANTSSLGESITINLAAGNYYVQVASAGGKQASTNGGAWQAAQFYDMGSYFLTGFVSVPEPATVALFGSGILIVGLWWVRRRRLQEMERKVC